MANISYSAVVLDDESHQKLVKIFKSMIPENWKVLAHHMTIKMGALDPESQAKKDLADGSIITLNVEDYAIDDKVMAVGVEGYVSMNIKPHITLAVNVNEGGKPVMSNQLTDWRPIPFPLKLTGKVTEVQFK
jgi:hypothetical protein